MNTGLGILIRKYRKEKGMTQEDLGKAIGLSGKSGISKLERGINDASTETVIKIAKVLEVSPAVFLEQKETYSEFAEYLPYLAQASEETIRNIRYMLGMSEKNPSVSDSFQRIG